jgi:DNA-binding NarL/FixJ family response regulator
MDDKLLITFYARLTNRQQQVLHLLCDGLTNKEIARQLCIEPCVVAGHLTNIYGEMGTQAVFADAHPNRYTVILNFVPFFARFTELRDAAFYARK